MPASIPDLAPEPQGWDSQIHMLTIAEIRPRLIVEVGTWKGGVSFTWGQFAVNFSSGCAEIVCVDTWLGNWAALGTFKQHREPGRY